MELKKGGWAVVQNVLTTEKKNTRTGEKYFEKAHVLVQETVVEVDATAQLQAESEEAYFIVCFGIRGGLHALYFRSRRLP